MSSSPAFPEVFDSTMLSAARGCHQKFFRQHIEGWKLGAPSVDLVAGAAFAEGIEVARRGFYSGGDSAETAVQRGTLALIQHYGDFQPPPRTGKTLEGMTGAFEYYFQRYPLGTDPYHPITLPDGKLGIELLAVEPLPVLHPETGYPILFSGRPDLVTKYGNSLYLLDEKTSGPYQESWLEQWSLRAQFLSYCWLMRSLLPIHGVIVRGVFIQLAKGVYNYESHQVPIHFEKWLVDQWLEAAVMEIESLIAAWKKGFWRKNFDSTCGAYRGCELRNACRMQDPTPYLQTYAQRIHWDPITRTKTNLGTTTDD